MRNLKTIFALALALVAASFAAPPLSATTVIASAAAQESTLAFGVVNVTSDYTNATTSATDVTGLSITVPATNYAIGAQFYRVCWTLDTLKATATTGNIVANVNGSDVTGSARYTATGAGRVSNANCFVGARPTASAFVVKLRGVSADTNALTVYAGGQMTVEVFYFPQ